MKLTFLGTGGFFSKKHGHSNMLLESGEAKMLIDAGWNIGEELENVDLGYLDITEIYISHVHGDHAGGLEHLGFAHRFDPRSSEDDPLSQPITLIAHPEVMQQLVTMLTPPMGIIRDGDLRHVGFGHWFRPRICEKFYWENELFKLHPNKHLMTSYGLVFKDVYISTDTAWDADWFEDIRHPFFDSKIIFQDCNTDSGDGDVHASFEQLCTLPDLIKEKMWLYHYGDGKLPNAKANGFAGFVKKGQVFEL